MNRAYAKQILSRAGLLDPVRRARAITRKAAQLTLHSVRERLVRLPDPRFVLRRGSLPPPYREHLADLNRDGITRLSGEISPPLLAELQRAFSEFIARLEATGTSTDAYTGDITVTDEYFDPDGRQYSSNEPFKFSRALLEVCLKPELTSLINAYLGKQAYITQGVAFRIYPLPHTGYGSFQWHHDAWGKRINMMILLTEVGAGDQHMTYAKGSHRLHHSYDKYVNSRFSREEFSRYCGDMEVLNCYAKPGDIYIFDSNGVHSGNRSTGRARDVFILEYTRIAQAIWAHEIPKSYLTGFDEERLLPLQWILRQDRGSRPLAPPVNSWVDGLLRPSQWSI